LEFMFRVKFGHNYVQLIINQSIVIIIDDTTTTKTQQSNKYHFTPFFVFTKEKSSRTLR